MKVCASCRSEKDHALQVCSRGFAQPGHKFIDLRFRNCIFRSHLRPPSLPAAACTTTARAPATETAKTAATETAPATESPPPAIATASAPAKHARRKHPDTKAPKQRQPSAHY